MRVVFIIIFFALISCKHEKQKSHNAKNLPIEKIQMNLPAQWPSIEDLNRKQFYSIRTTPNNLNLKSNLYCVTNENYPLMATPNYGHYKIYLNADDVTKFCDSMLSVLSKDNYIVKSYTRLRKNAIESEHRLVKCDSDLLSELLVYCQCKIFDIRRKEYPDQLILKFYNTMCTKAEKDYDLIYQKRDTVKFIDHQELCIN